MNSLLYALTSLDTWKAFYQDRLDKGHLRQEEKTYLQEYIDNETYLPIANIMITSPDDFPLPEKHRINKGSTGKKRTVYQFPDKESWCLKCLCFLMQKYDSVFHDSCYSFRSSNSAKSAIKKICRLPHLEEKYAVKVDIHNYFNSIPAGRLVEELEAIFPDDPLLLKFLSSLLLKGQAIFKHTLIREERGAMAGVPISPFFANCYLTSLDQLFDTCRIPYFRYSDDILFFVDSMEEADYYKELLFEHITQKGLTINEDKYELTTPGESWNFLGFCYRNGEIDLSENTKNKVKKKIRRKAKGLYKWRIEKKVSFDITARYMIRTFNHKFYSQDDKDFSWTRWFFPVLTTDKGLKEIDRYFVEYIRYLYKGRHYKGNFQITYSDIKAKGYRSLVNEYYKTHSIQ